MQGRRLLSFGLALAALAGASLGRAAVVAAGNSDNDQGGGKSEAACRSDGCVDRPDGLDLAAKALGCEPKRVKPLGPPLDGVWEVRCDGGVVIWLNWVDGAWTVRPLG